MKNKSPLVCFLPCRKGSERIPRKNIKPFSDFKNGLIEIKINQLLLSKKIDKIILSTNDKEIIDFANSFQTERLIIHEREDYLSTSLTSTDTLVGHANELIENAHILWTHVTSPFITALDYDKIISQYYNSLEKGFDSLMTTTLIHGFLWDKTGPTNYDRKIEKWPRTQTLEPIHEVNSGVFLAHSNIYNKFNDRIGETPFLYTLDKLKSQDIDWPEDFILAEQLIKTRLVKI
tara:strand:- start:92 stop:790 length:699 start_codon:yes stop_codon:yes gene_type:complete